MKTGAAAVLIWNVKVERETYSKRTLAAIVARRYSGRIRSIVTPWLGTEAEKLPFA
jgi:hypothetical protein